MDHPRNRAHLADTEFVAGMRLRQIIAENKPNLVLFDQDAWARELGYNKLDPFESLGRFRVLREINADMIAGLPVEALRARRVSSGTGSTNRARLG